MHLPSSDTVTTPLGPAGARTASNPTSLTPLALPAVFTAALALLGFVPDGPAYDAVIHCIFLGFTVSMIMAHAPVILPAVAGVKLQFGPAFYVPLALLHSSLLLRLGVDRSWGALLNTAALALFALTAVAAALLWRRHHRA